MIALPSRWGIGRFLLCLPGAVLVFCLLAPSTQAQSLPLYTVAPCDSQLRTLDPLTGQTLSSVTIMLSGVPVNSGNGLARNPMTGVLFAIVNNCDSGSPRLLVTINPSTGEATLVGNPGSKFAGITFASDGTLYGVTGDGATPPSTLYTLNTTTGAKTFVKTLGNGCDGEAIAFNPLDGLIYHASGAGICQIFEKINPTTLAVTSIPLSGETYGEATSLTYWASGLFLLGDLSDDLSLVSSTGRVKDVISSIGYTPKGMAFAGTPPVCPPLAPLYGAANLGNTGPSILYSLDPTSGAPTLIGPIGFEAVSGIAFNSAGTLFGSGSRQDINPETGVFETFVLLTINPCTGAGTQVGATGIEEFGFSATTDISFRHSSSALFAVVKNPLTLGTLNTSTGQFTQVGLLNLVDVNGNGLAFSSSDVLFHADNVSLNHLDPTTGAATFVANLTFPSGGVANCRANALDFQPSTGILFASVTCNNPDFIPLNFLATINTTTGDVSFFSSPEEVFLQTELGLDAIAFSPALVESIFATGGTPQRATITTAFATKLQATVRDIGSNPVPNVTVTFTPPGSGASGTFTGGNTAVTNSSGVATSNTFTANGTTGGPYIVHATFAPPAAAGTSSAPIDASFSLTNVDYAVAPVTSTKTVAAGGTANYNLNFTAIVGNTTDPTALSCQNLPSLASCVFNPASFPANSGNAPFTLAISTTASHTSLIFGTGNRLDHPLLSPLRPVLLLLFAMLAMSLTLYFKRMREFARLRLSAIGIFAALLLFAGCLAGCGGLGAGFPAQTIVPGTPAGTYTVTVVATAGTTTRTTTVTLIVQ